MNLAALHPSAPPHQWRSLPSGLMQVQPLSRDSADVPPLPRPSHPLPPPSLLSHRKKRMQQIRKQMQRGLLDPEKEDPFSLFVASTSIRYCYYSETQNILGNTFGMCVLQVRGGWGMRGEGGESGRGDSSGTVWSPGLLGCAGMANRGPQRAL